MLQWCMLSAAGCAQSEKSAIWALLKLEFWRWKMKRAPVKPTENGDWDWYCLRRSCLTPRRRRLTAVTVAHAAAFMAHRVSRPDSSRWARATAANVVRLLPAMRRHPAALLKHVEWRKTSTSRCCWPCADIQPRFRSTGKTLEVSSVDPYDGWGRPAERGRDRAHRDGAEHADDALEAIRHSRACRNTGRQSRGAEASGGRGVCGLGRAPALIKGRGACCKGFG